MPSSDTFSRSISSISLASSAASCAACAGVEPEVRSEAEADSAIVRRHRATSCIKISVRSSPLIAGGASSAAMPVRLVSARLARSDRSSSPSEIGADTRHDDSAGTGYCQKRLARGTRCTPCRQQQ